MNEVAQRGPSAPSLIKSTPLAQCKTLGEAFQSSELLERIKASVPAHMNPNRMLRTFVQAVSYTPTLAQANMRSVLGAFLSCSQLGLEPNTPLGHAYLIPFEKRRKQGDQWVTERVDVQLILGYRGLLDLAFRSGLVTSIQCQAVLPGDDFSFEYGTNGHLRHVPTGKADESADPAYVYMHARMKGGEAFEVLPWSRVIAIRNQSQGYRAALAARERAEREGKRLPPAWTEAPWVKHAVPMGRKTAMRAGSKWLPTSIEMAAALAMDEAQDRTRLDFGAVFEGSATVLDGGLPAMDSGDDEDEGTDAGAAFSVRGATGSTSAPTGEQAAAGATTTAAASTPATASPTVGTGGDGEFWSPLLDEHGEVRGEPYGDPVAFAQAYAELHRSAANPAALREHNEDALVDAMSGNAEARQILQSLPTEGAQPGHAVIEIPMNGQRADYRVYLERLEAAVGTIPADELDAWAQAQEPSLSKLPKATRKLADNLIAGRKTGAGTGGGGGDPGQGQGQAAAEQSDATKHKAIADGLIADINGAKTLSDLNLLAANAAVTTQIDTLDKAAPAEAQRVRAAADARRTALRSAQGG